MFVALVLIYVALVIKNLPMLYVFVGLNGFVNLSIYSVSYELGVELTYPVGEAMSGGFLNTLASIMAVIFINCMTPILETQT